MDVPLLGRGHLANALAAMAVAGDYGVPVGAMVERLAALRPAPRRGEVWRLASGVTLVDDSYNSNPRALQRTLEAVAAERECRRRLAVLGEMLELGDQAVALHDACGRSAAHAGSDAPGDRGRRAGGGDGRAARCRRDAGCGGAARRHERRRGRHAGADASPGRRGAGEGIPGRPHRHRGGPGQGGRGVSAGGRGSVGHAGAAGGDERVHRAREAGRRGRRRRQRRGRRAPARRARRRA